MAWVAIWTQPVTTALEFVQAAFSAVAVEIGDVDLRLLLPATTPSPIVSREETT